MKKPETIEEGIGFGILFERNGAIVWGNKFWHFPWRVYNCLCEDGIRRCIRLNQQSDYCWYGDTKIKNKSVRGFITVQDEDYIFISFKFAN